MTKARGHITEGVGEASPLLHLMPCFDLYGIEECVASTRHVKGTPRLQSLGEAPNPLESPLRRHRDGIGHMPWFLDQSRPSCQSIKRIDHHFQELGICEWLEGLSADSCRETAEGEARPRAQPVFGNSRICHLPHG